MTIVPITHDLTVATLREQIAPDASEQELIFFAHVCKTLDLTPFRDQIYLIGRYDKKLDQSTRGQRTKLYKPQLSILGRRTIASRTGRWQGTEGPWWTDGERECPVHGPVGLHVRRCPHADCGRRTSIIWEELWEYDDEGVVPYAARSLTWVQGWRVPANGTVKWSEFAKTDGADAFFWRKEPSYMLGKVSEALSLRRAFTEVDAAVKLTGEAETDTISEPATMPHSGTPGLEPANAPSGPGSEHHSEDTPSSDARAPRGPSTAGTSLVSKNWIDGVLAAAMRKGLDDDQIGQVVYLATGRTRRIEEVQEGEEAEDVVRTLFGRQPTDAS